MLRSENRTFIILWRDSKIKSSQVKDEDQDQSPMVMELFLQGDVQVLDMRSEGSQSKAGLPVSSTIIYIWIF